MSKTLEFIEEQIKKEQSMIKTYEEYFKTDKTEFDKQITNGYIQIHQKNINLLQQIKTDLEAWEVCKKFIVNLGGEYNLCIDNYHNVNEYQTLKKALEVKDEH